MRAKTFLIVTLCCFVVGCVAYFLAVDKLAVPSRAIDKSYKQFLLKASASIENRIIVDAGSNSIYGIDAGELETYFQRLTLVLGDNASYPLAHKLNRMRRYLNVGDVVVLPLEWSHYANGNVVPGVYVDSILDQEGSNSFYYRNLPLVDRFLFVFRHIPYALGMERAIHRNAFEHKNYDLRQSIKQSRHRFAVGIYYQRRGDFSGVERIAREYAKQQYTDCNRYVLTHVMAENYTISDKFIDNLALMRRIADDTGARFVFTWPAVTDYWENECYRGEAAEPLAEYAAAIKALVSEFGFDFVGDYKEHRYDKGCFWDTYYHLSRECALVNTRKLIDELESIGIHGHGGYEPESTTRVMLRYLFNAGSPNMISSQRLDETIIGMEMPDHISLLQGWGHVSPMGPWSVGDESVIGIPVGDLPVVGLRLQGRYFHGEEKTGVWINDKFMGKHLLLDHTFDVAGLAGEDGMFVIRFQHANPVAPASVSDSSDTRLLKFGLVSVTLLSDGGEAAPEN